jgi:hypothetical protein
MKMKRIRSTKERKKFKTVKETKIKIKREEVWVPLLL